MKNATIWQFSANIIALLLGMGQLAILARLLDVSAFGVIAIVWVVVYISQAISDAGMSNYLIYKQTVSKSTNSTIFWVSLCLGGIVAIVVGVVSPYIALWYQQPDLDMLIKLTSFHFIFTGLSSQLQARFLLDFKHALLAKIEIVSKIFGISCSIICAVYYPKAWVIVVGLVVTTATKMILLWICAQSDWYPRFSFSKQEAKKGIQYGSYQMGGQILNQLRGNLDTLLLASFLSPASLGIYSLAKSITIKPSQVLLPAVYKLMLPYIAKHQNKPTDLIGELNKVHYWIGAILSLIYGILIFLAEPFIDWFYGSGYEEMYSVFVPLSLFWFLRSVGGVFVGAACQALGQTKREFNWNVISFILNVTVTSIAVQFGSVILAWSLVIMQLCSLPIIHCYIFKSLFNMSRSSYFSPILVTMLSISIIVIPMDYTWDFFVKSDFSFLNLSLVTLFALPCHYLLLKKITKKHSYFPALSELRAKM